MKIRFRLPLEGSPDLLLDQSPWTGSSHVFAGDLEIPSERRGRVRTFWVPLTDGTRVQLQLKNSGIDVLPRAAVLVGDPPVAQMVTIARAMSWWEYLLCALPLLLVPVGGVVGGVIGALATYVNLRVMRSELASPLRALETIGVLFAAAAIYGAVAVALTLATGGGR